MSWRLMTTRGYTSLDSDVENRVPRPERLLRFSIEKARRWAPYVLVFDFAWELLPPLRPLPPKVSSSRAPVNLVVDSPLVMACWHTGGFAGAYIYRGSPVVIHSTVGTTILRACTSVCSLNHLLGPSLGAPAVYCAS